MGFLYRLVKWVIIITIAVFAINYWLANKGYIFSENDITKIALKHAGSDVSKSFALIHKDLRSSYPGHVLPKEDLQWVLYNAGGWMVTMCVVHMSFTEAVLFFGTPIDTRGQSGRFWANVTTIVLSGEVIVWREGQMTVQHNLKGSVYRQIWGDSLVRNLLPNTWLVKYARGFMPSILPFASSSTLFSTVDFVGILRLWGIYAKCHFMEASTLFYTLTT